MGTDARNSTSSLESGMGEDKPVLILVANLLRALGTQVISSLFAVFADAGYPYGKGSVQLFGLLLKTVVVPALPRSEIVQDRGRATAHFGCDANDQNQEIRRQDLC